MKVCFKMSNLYNSNIPIDVVLLGNLKGNELQPTEKNCVVLVVCV
jgi:hypothetical protein